MTKPTIPTHPDARYKVRIHLAGNLIHVITRTEPAVTIDLGSGFPTDCELDLIPDTADGDTIGYIDWGRVSAVTWRAIE